MKFRRYYSTHVHCGRLLSKRLSSRISQLESADSFLRNAVDVFEGVHNNELTIVFPLLDRETVRQTLK